jgi:hypothetical protein
VRGFPSLAVFVFVCTVARVRVQFAKIFRYVLIPYLADITECRCVIWKAVVGFVKLITAFFISFILFASWQFH